MTSPIRRAPRETRAEAAADTIRSSILSGRYVSGERLIEVKLAQALNVSQNTIREALRILEAEGWVVKQARRGVYVRSFTPDDAAEVCALIESVETVALVWLLQRGDKTTRAELHTLVVGARKAAYAGDRNEAVELLLRFHICISTAARRPLTAQLLETLYNQVRLLEALRQARAPHTLRELEAQISAHEVLYRAIEAGDADAACQRLREQITAYSALAVAALRV